MWGDESSQLADCNCQRYLFHQFAGEQVSEARTAGVPRREALVIGLDRLDDEGVGNALPTPLPLVDEEAVRTCGTAAAKGCSTGRLFHGIW